MVHIAFIAAKNIAFFLQLLLAALAQTTGKSARYTATVAPSAATTVSAWRNPPPARRRRRLRKQSLTSKRQDETLILHALANKEHYKKTNIISFSNVFLASYPPGLCLPPSRASDCQILFIYFFKKIILFLFAGN